MNELKTNENRHLGAPRGLRFGIANLFVVIAIFACAAWLFSIGYLFASCVGLGLVVGIGFGLKCHYPTLLMAVFGVVMGGLYACAILGTTAVQHFYTSSAIDVIEAGSKTMASETRMVLICLVSALWTMAILMTCWLLTLAFRATNTWRSSSGTDVPSSPANV